jgi:hypothetical protein
LAGPAASNVCAEAPEPAFLRLCQRIAASGSGNDDVVRAARGTDDLAARKALLSMLETEPSVDIPPIQKLMDDRVRTEAVELLITGGAVDVVPILRRWARSIASESGAIDRDKLAALVYQRKLELVQIGLISFHANEALPELHAMLSSANPQVHQAAVYTIAALDVPESVDMQEEIVHDQKADPSARCRAAIALVRIGRDSGRALLLESYRGYLRELEVQTTHYAPFGCRDDMETLYDPELVATLEALAAAQPTGVPKRNIETLVATMRLNEKTIDQLKQLAADNNWARARQTRYPAIKELARRGGPELIPFLEQLKPWVNPSGVEAVCGQVEGQRQVMAENIIAPAIAELRLRAERETAQKSNPTAQPK